MPETKAAVEPGPLLRRLMEAYRYAWETRDSALILELFTEDATYQENPFNRPIAGHAGIRRYWEGATGGQRDINFRWQPVSSTENFHVVEWQAGFTHGESGRRIELRGVMFLELRGERISRFREYWHRRESI